MEQKPNAKPDGKPDAKPVDERLKNLDPQMVELIQNEMIDAQTNKVSWEDIAGLQHAKKTIYEAIIWPMQRPDIFTGLRGPPKGVLLFGPPGTGKTLIAKAIAAQCQTSFFSISSSSLTSKWVGEGEKMMRTLFAVARVNQPAVIFMDEIDSLLCKRTEGENDAARKIKTEFLVQFDGCGTAQDDRILIIGATNRPQELDDAARRRFRKKLYIPLPDFEARLALFKNLLKKERHSLTEDQMFEISKLTEGYSGSDCDNLCRDAALGPIRDLQNVDMANMDFSTVEPIGLRHLVDAMAQIKASVSSGDLEEYVKYEQEFGSNR
jgi:SpoVK/Ycf46/Vps4 family AAA+-type ATPase